jgi:membrane protease YdiL (CAAX protease family)
MQVAPRSRPGWVTAHFGPFTSAAPLFYLAVWAPNIAALLVTLATLGWVGISDLLARLVRWRVSLWVWAAALLFYPTLMLVVELVGLAFGDPLPGPGNWRALALGLVSLPLIALGPLGEELGWRGFLLPRLLLRMKPLTAALVLGTIWMIWHVPAFLMSGVPQSTMSFPIFVFGGVALSVFLTWLFLNARQSILISGVIPHAIANAWGDAIGPMTWINAGVLVAGAVLLVWLGGLRNRPSAGRTESKAKVQAS